MITVEDLGIRKSTKSRKNKKKNPEKLKKYIALPTKARLRTDGKLLENVEKIGQTVSKITTQGEKLGLETEGGNKRQENL